MVAYILIDSPNGVLTDEASVTAYKSKLEAQIAMEKEVREHFMNGEELPNGLEIGDTFAFDPYDPDSREWHIYSVNIT